MMEFKISKDNSNSERFQDKKLSNFITEIFYLNSFDKAILYVKKWSPKHNFNIKGVIIVAHGLGENTDFYDEFVAATASQGFISYINDARGHGKTAGDITNPSYFKKAGDIGKDGITKMVEDLFVLTLRAREENPGLPVFLLGHSLGSILAQVFAIKHGSCINGIIYSGTMGYINDKDLYHLINSAKDEIEERGRNAKSIKAFNTLFEHANDEFEPSKTGFDWITSDEVLLAESLNSPYASVLFTAGFYLDLFNALVDVKQAKNLLRIPRDLPIFSVSGSKDPFGFNGFGVKTLFEGYKSLGFKDASYNIYKNKRHSILRETNRAQVTLDIISWINERISN